MTVQRRSLLLLSATAAFLFPACIGVNAKPVPITPADVAARITAEGAAKATESVRKSEFAIYPSRPGETVPTKTVARDATTAQKPNPGNSDVNPAGPIVPPTPPSHASGTAANDPRAFPLAAHRTNVVTEPPLLAAVRAFIEGRQERALDHIMALDKPNQDLVLAMLPVLARGATADLTSDTVAIAMLLEQLRSATARLEPRAPLRVETILFCREVSGFGIYDARRPNEPYRPNGEARLYLEVRNLVSQPAAGPRGEKFLTQVRAVVEIRDAYNNIVPHADPDDARRRVPVLRFDSKRSSQSPIQDFHVMYTFPVPTAPGVYTATVELRDASGRRMVRTAPVEFTVAGP